jgi:hypothetical protein
MIESPVLLIVFNRPDTTQKVFDAIKGAKPQKLYIAADAPRIGNREDEKNCIIVKEIIKQVEWDCDVHYRFVDVNLGCGPAPYNAISWAFENEDRLIILEDDCVPAFPFFGFCNDLLERYKNDTRIWIISGNQYNEEAVKTPHSYFFSRYGHSQGWATWRRCWPKNGVTMEKWPLMKQQDILKAVFASKEETTYFEKMFDNAYSDISLNDHAWDIQFSFYLRSNNALSIVPAKHLVTNIGYTGTHSSGKLWYHDLPVDEFYEIKSHPDFVLPDVNYDNWHFKHHWNRPPKISIYKKIKQMIRCSVKWIINK